MLPEPNPLAVDEVLIHLGQLHHPNNISSPTMDVIHADAHHGCFLRSRKNQGNVYLVILTTFVAFTTSRKSFSTSSHSPMR